MVASSIYKSAPAWCPASCEPAGLPLVEADRHLLATFYQENLKYVRSGQHVEVSLDLYPGQIFTGKVDSIWLDS
jgi:multidrug resistance efflux pump